MLSLIPLFGALSVGTTTMKTISDQKQRESYNREESQLRLEEVLQRYGLKAPSDGKPWNQAALWPANEFGVTRRTDGTALARAGAYAATTHHGWSVASSLTDAFKPASGEFASQSPGFMGCPATWSADDEVFHYLISVAESSVILHCQIIARNAELATVRLRQVPNLIKWRRISAEQLLLILQNEEKTRTADSDMLYFAAP